MRDYLESFQLVLEVEGPVFVGNGKEIGKKEYVTLQRGKIGVVDVEKLYYVLKRKGLSSKYEEFLMMPKSSDLTKWLRDNRIQQSEMQQFVKYELDYGDAQIEKGTRLQIMEIMKDPYGNPYIPGSSVKGMLRTILMNYEMLQNPTAYAGLSIKISGAVDNFRGRSNYLKREASEGEALTFRSLNRPDTRPDDAVNDVLAGLLVSDSYPLSIDDLVLCQKIEVHTDGSEKKLNLLRESLKPGTKIVIPLTIDSTTCKYAKEDIEDAVSSFSHFYYKTFCSHFPSDRPKETTVWLGGGTGYASKTAIYPLFNDRDRVMVVKTILEKTVHNRQHGHANDHKQGVSPHILKCTYYQGKTVQMGQCRMQILPFCPAP